MLIVFFLKVKGLSILKVSFFTSKPGKQLWEQLTTDETVNLFQTVFRIKLL